MNYYKISNYLYFNLITMLILTILTSGCGVKEIPNTNTLEINTREIDSITQDYYLRSGDSIKVTFFNHPELNESLTIRPDGKISLQLIDDIMVEGLTPSELDSKLTETYAKHLNNSEITVIVQSFKGQEIYVAGEVLRPGEIELTGKLNALQAIFISGGFTDDARRAEVVIISRGPDNKPVARKVNLKKALKGNLLENEYLLRPFDLVYIPKTRLSKIDDFTTHMYRIISPRIWRGLAYEPGTSFEVNW
jgi:protein involved in polysaccharide export with SLBB domain